MTRPGLRIEGEWLPVVDPPYASGGEASLFLLEGRTDLLVKIYREPLDDLQERKLARMVEMNPLRSRPTHQAQPPELAWPLALVHGDDERCLGYAMRHFDGSEHAPLAGLFNRRGRRALFKERVDWRFLLGVGFNLAFVIARTHHEDLVVGDLSATNTLVDRAGFVTLLDCDSFSFTDPVAGERFPSPVRTAEYSAPERLDGAEATGATDDFALAILLFQLITAGQHPFGGVPRDSAEAGSVQDNIASNRSYVVRPEAMIVPSTLIPPEDVLSPPILALCRQAFGPGSADPSQRPSSVEWVQALDEEIRHCRPCDRRPMHTYASHLHSCPWCRHAEATGHDPFN